VLVFAAFNYDAAAQAVIQDNSDPRLQLVQADIDKTANPAMGGLLKNTVHQQLFTVSGSPRTRLDKTAAGEFVVTMEDVDIYDPKENSVNSTGSGKVAAWFLDSDYDGRTFCITQAFFPDKTAWDKIASHLDRAGAIDAERFAAFGGTVSLPFPMGRHKRAAVKVIDPRGSEVMKVHRLDGYEA
jgi:adenine-specific DNA-methyltransferase